MEDDYKQKEGQMNESTKPANTKHIVSSQTQILTKNISQLPSPLQTSISSIITTVKNLNSSIPLLQSSQIIQSLADTVKRATQPQINSFNFDKGFNNNLYPVFGIIAWKNDQLGYNLIDWRICSFVQSGGVRCVPILQCDLSDAKNLANLKGQIENIHGLVVPQYYQQNSTDFLDNLSTFIDQQYEKDLFVLSFGNSSNFLLTKKHEKLAKSAKQKSGLIEGRIVNVLQSDLLADINLILKLKVLSEIIDYPFKCLPEIDLTELNKIEELFVEGYVISSQKGNQVIPWLIKQKISEKIIIYHSFIQLYDKSCSKGLQYLNKTMINFVNLGKQKPQNIKNPTKYVAHYPLEFKESAQKAHYKITLNQLGK